MVYVTGDTHGDLVRFIEGNMEGEKDFTEEDHLLIAGDFGFIFFGNEREEAVLDELEKKPYTILFIDGNHENFPKIYSYPKEEFHGGMAHKIRKNIFHLCRGEVFEIEGKSFFCMGGAYSRDKYIRTEGLSWWQEELPNNDEYRAATSSLKKMGNRVDYIITHTAPRKVIFKMKRNSDLHDSELTGFFDWIDDTVEYKKWFFGHWHTDLDVDLRHRAVYYDVVKID